MKKVFSSFQFVAVILLVIYMLFPTSNSTIDAYAYASNAKYGEDLFQSHHLLYSVSGYLWCEFLNVFDVNPLKALKILNALFAFFSLLMLGGILKRLGFEKNKVLVWIFFVGSSWALMRFSTENETYVIPIFFSLVGSYSLLLYMQSSKIKYLFLSGLFAAIACLYHQIHFFWWLAMAIIVLKEYRFYKSLVFILPALIVPIVYLLVLCFYSNSPCSIDSFFQFVFRDFINGNATVNFGIKSFVLTVISFIRTFFQLHGYLAVLFSKLIFGVLLLIPIFLLGYSLFFLKLIKFDFPKLKNKFLSIHLLAFLLHLHFAFLSSGNAEFMVMLPFLLTIFMSIVLINEVRFLLLLSLGMLIWNIFYGLYPLNQFTLDGVGLVKNHIVKNNDSEGLYILFNKPHIENVVYYEMQNNRINYISGTYNVSPGVLMATVDSALKKGSKVYTDCLYRPKTWSRESLTLSSQLDFSAYKAEKIDSINTITGRYFLVQLMKRD